MAHFAHHKCHGKFTSTMSRRIVIAMPVGARGVTQASTLQRRCGRQGLGGHLAQAPSGAIRTRQRAWGGRVVSNQTILDLADMSRLRTRLRRATKVGLMSLAAVGVAVIAASQQSAAPQHPSKPMAVTLEAATDVEASSFVAAEDKQDLDRYDWRIANTRLGNAPDLEAALLAYNSTAVTQVITGSTSGGASPEPALGAQGQIAALKYASPTSSTSAARGNGPWSPPQSQPMGGRAPRPADRTGGAQTPVTALTGHAAANPSTPLVIAAGPDDPLSAPEPTSGPSSSPVRNPRSTKPPVVDTRPASPTGAEKGLPVDGGSSGPPEKPRRVVRENPGEQSPPPVLPGGESQEPPAPNGPSGESPGGDLPSATTPAGDPQEAPAQDGSPGSSDDAPRVVDVFSPENILEPIAVMPPLERTAATPNDKGGTAAPVALVASVPEPASVLLLSVGLAVVGVLTRRRQTRLTATAHEPKDSRRVSRH